MYEAYRYTILLCEINYWWRKDSSTKNQDCTESRGYVDQGGDGDQV